MAGRVAAFCILSGARLWRCFLRDEAGLLSRAAAGGVPVYRTIRCTELIAASAY